MKRIFTWLVIAGLVLVLGVANYDIWQKQQVVENGQQILLELRPVDPRSLIQGDFMRLRYSETVFPNSVSGVTPHMERCTPFRYEGDELVTVNTCEEAVVVQFMPSGQFVIERTLEPGEAFATGLSRPASYVFATCPVGYETTVLLREQNRSIISRSQYRCVAATVESMLRTGTIVLALDADDVGTFARDDDGSPLAANETRLQYKLILTTGDLRLGAESFFFQEGQAQVFQDARYGVLRVDENGASVLVGLADDERQLITPP
jgi:uncharacterized membrane-anchored protein